MIGKEDIKVSIILPSLNVGDYIEEAVESARKQTLHDIEIICVDAGSTDGTREIVAKHAAVDDRIVVIYSPVKSYGYQVNAGIDAAKGEYIAILETDDYVDWSMYGSLYDLAGAYGLDYAKCDYDTYTIDENGDRLFATRRAGRNISLYVEPFVPAEHPDTAFDDWYLWNGIYRADFLRHNNIRFSETPGAAFQDIGFLHKTTSGAGSVMYLNRSLYRYCVSRPEASSKSDRTLRYIRQEYGLLADEIGIETDPDELNLFYRRMAKSFARACMDCSDATLADEQTDEIIGWFRSELSKAQSEGYISAEMIPAGLREAYRHLMISKADYLAYRMNRACEMKEFLGTYHPVVIFGCGIYGREALGYINGLGREISCFMDNSDKLWGKHIEGIKVEKPEKILQMSADTRFVVANENHADEIAAQIAQNVDGNRILIY